jgi:hypothetical protein
MPNDDPRCRDPKQYKGLNKLGEALMKIRNMLNRDDGNYEEVRSVRFCCTDGPSSST